MSHFSHKQLRTVNSNAVYDFIHYNSLQLVTCTYLPKNNIYLSFFFLKSASSLFCFSESYWKRKKYDDVFCALPLVLQRTKTTTNQSRFFPSPSWLYMIFFFFVVVIDTSPGFPINIDGVHRLDHTSFFYSLWTV